MASAVLCRPAQTQAASLAASTEPARGVVLIVVDALRADRVGARTPAIEAFFASGARFAEARSHAPWTLPSALAMMTSLHPSRHGVLNRYRDFSADPLVPARLQDARPGTITLAQTLRAAGWRTAAFTGGAGFAGDTGLAQGFEVYDDSPTFSGFARTVPAARAWLEALKPGERFFLFVHGADVHPFHPGRLSPGLLAAHKRLREAGLDGKPLDASARQRRALTASYDAAVRAMDRRLAPLLRRLAGPAGDGVVVALTADHGEELFDHGGVDHGATLREELIHVPLLLRGPGVPAARLASPVRHVDLMPTLLDLAGVQAQPALAAQMDGMSLRPLLGGSALALDSFAETDFLLSASLRSVVTRDGWKAVLDRRANAVSLYKLEDDPRELKDLSAAQPQRASALEARLRAVSAEPARAQAPSAAARRGAWKALRRGEHTELYDLSADPYLTRDVAAEHPELVVDFAADFVKAAGAGSRETHEPSDALRKKLREAGYW